MRCQLLLPILAIALATVLSGCVVAPARWDGYRHYDYDGDHWRHHRDDDGDGWHHHQDRW